LNELEQLLAPIRGIEARTTTHALRLHRSNKLIVGRSLLEVSRDFIERGLSAPDMRVAAGDVARRAQYRHF
jgi:hypothetical protein